MSRMKVLITDDNNDDDVMKIVDQVSNLELSNHAYDAYDAYDVYEDLEVLNNGGVSYIIKKYMNKSIISIYHVKNSKKYGLITTKCFRNFYSDNQSYLAELKKEKYEYIFIGGEHIYEFSLFPEDSFVSFNCYIGNSVTYSYIIGKKYTYFLTEKCAIDNSIIKGEKDPYKVLYDIGGEVFFDICDKSKYFMGKPCKNDNEKYDIKEIEIKEEMLNIDLDKLNKKAENYFNDIEKRYIEYMMEFKMTWMKNKSYAKKVIKDEMDNKQSWAKFRIEHFKSSVKGIEEKNRVSYMKRCIEDYLNIWLYKPETAQKQYCLFLDLWYSSL